MTWKSAEEYKREQDAQAAQQSTNAHKSHGFDKAEIDGHVIAKFPESLFKDFIAAQKESARRETKKYRIEVVGAWIAGLYLVITGFLLLVNSCQLSTLKEQFQIDQRPRIAVRF